MVQIQVGDNSGAVGGDIILSAGKSSSKTGGTINIISGIGTEKSSGSVSIITSNAGNNGVSGNLVFQSGRSLSGSSGAITLITGSATNGKGGSISLSIGSGTVSSGGSIVIQGGDGQNGGGDINIYGGTSTSSSGGHVYLKGGDNSPASAQGGNVILSVGTGMSSIVIRDENSNELATFTSSQATIASSCQTTLSNPFTVQSWKMSSSGSTATAILRGTVVIDCTGGNQIYSNNERDIDVTTTGVQLKDFIVMNPSTDSVAQSNIFWSAWARTTNGATLRITNLGGTTYSQSGTWVWFVIRSLS